MYTGANEWNKLPVSLQTVAQKHIFKKNLKNFLFRKFLDEETSDYINA